MSISKKDWAYVSRWAKKIKAIEFLGGKCRNCKTDDIFILEFHHENEKIKDETIYSLLESRWSSIEKEIKKCILLCSNCHAELHSEIDKNGKDLRVGKLKNELLRICGQSSCLNCGYDKCSSGLDFHHILEKDFTITNEISKGKSLTERIIKEVDKCNVLCRNCHKKEHVDVKRFRSLKDVIYDKKKNSYELPVSKMDEIKEMKSNGYKQFEVVNLLGCAKSTVSRIWKM